jgi:dienelactone hydrolase
MSRWCGLLGLLLWLGGTITAAVATYGGGIRTSPARVRLADGTIIRGTVYRGRAAVAPAPAAVVLHGTAVTHASCAPGLALPLARIGFVVLAIDLRGHGRSGGTLPRSEYDNLETMLNTPAEQPELDAAIAYLQVQPDVDGRRVALVGQSRGGWMAAAAGCRREDVACVVCVSSAPTLCDPLRPRNLLFLAGGLDQMIPPCDYRAAFARATAAQGEPGACRGDRERGTARQLIVSRWALHLSTLADPSTTRRAVQWSAWSLRRDPGNVPGDRLWTAGVAVVLASLGGLLALGAIVAELARRLLPAPAAVPWGRARPALAPLLLLPVLAAPAAAWLGDRLPDGGVLFASHAFALLLAVAGFTALAAGWAVYSAGPPRRQAPAWRTLGRGGVVGSLASALGLTLLGVPWGTTWLDVVPAPGRVIVALLLLVLFLPCTLTLAVAVQGVLSRTAAGPALRGMAWLGLSLTMWLGHTWLVRPDRPFLGIPTLFVALSSVVPLPLWLLPPRPGLGMARATSHALAAACVLAWHLPFVHAG